MTQEGPPLERLLRRLSECPAEFMAEPRVGARGLVRVDAVVSDLLIDLGGSPLPPDQLSAFQSSNARKDRNRLAVVLVASWLLHDIWFRDQATFAGSAQQLLAEGLNELSAMVQAPKVISDPDRREELARLCLKELGLRPAGESIAQSQDRLTTLDSVERSRVIAAGRAAAERVRAIREAMAKQPAYEGADKYPRE